MDLSKYLGVRASIEHVAALSASQKQQNWPSWMGNPTGVEGEAGFGD